MKKIIIDTRMILPKIHGIGRYLWNLLQQFSQNKAIFSFTLLHNDKKVEPVLKEFGFPVIWVKSHRFSLLEQIEIPFILKKESPALFHSPSIFVPFISSCPTVITIHDLIPFIFKKNKSFFTDWYLYFLRNTCRNKVKKIIVPSENTCGDVERIIGVERDKISVIPYGVEEKFKVTIRPEEKDKVCRKYGISGKFIFSVINDNPHKNLKGVLDVFSIFTKRNEFSLVIAGNINAQKQVQSMGLEKKVMFLGYVAEEDLPCLYQSASLFVFPSLYEGFGLPILEALVSGLPVICFKTSSIPEVVGNGGILVDVNDVKAFAAAMTKVLEDTQLYAKLSENAKKRALSFSWEKSAQEHLKVYDTVIEGLQNRGKSLHITKKLLDL